MLKLYELLAKVGTNPKLRAWAMEQLIKLKHLKKGYKKSFTHEMDIRKAKDIKDPGWSTREFLKDQNFNLKTKVVPIDQGRKTVSIRKSARQSDKDKFYGVTGQVTTAVNRVKKNIDDFFKKHDLESKWFDKTLKKHLKGDKKATKALDQDRAIYEYEKWLKEKDKIIPFKPKKAEGGRIGFKKGSKKGGLGSLLTEMYRLFEIGPLLGSPELVDLIQKIPFEKGGRAGFDDGGPSQKEIDKGIAAIEKLKSSLMPESYEELIEIYKKKQKDLNIDIMESAGGLGEMLGEGGRVPMMYGGDPGFAFSYGGSWADWKENHASEMPVMDYINQKLPKARNPFTDTKYQDGGEVTLSWEEVFKKYMNGETLTDDETVTLGQVPLDKKAEGGRIGFQEGTGIMSQTGIPYYADKAVEGIVNSAETLSKLPFAAGKLGSQLLQSPPDKKMFSEALENITPGSWAENLGISSLAEAEGAKVSGKQRAVGDILGLGTEIAVPVGGAFKLGQNLINQASKSLGKLKKGKTLDQTINDKITDFGQSRRDFNIVAGTSGLLVALKAIGLGGLLKGASKKAEDFMVTLKTTIDDSDVMTDVGPVATGKWAGGFDIKSLTSKGSIIMNKILGKRTDDLGRDTYRYTTKEAHDSMKASKGKTAREINDLDTEEALDLVEQIKKAGGNMKFEHWDDAGGRGMDEALASYKKLFGKNSDEYKKLLAKSKKMTEKERVRYHSSITGDYGEAWDYTGNVDEILDTIYGKGIGKGEGGSVGWPPVQFNPKEQPPVQGPSYETNNPNEAFKEILRQSIGSGIASGNLGGGFSQGIGYGENKPFDYGIGYNTDPQSSGWNASYGINQGGNDVMSGAYNSPGGTFSMGVNKQEGSDPQFKFQKKWKFAKGGKAWQPKSAPKLTTTIPPESGPMPHGLTYLTGDDIVQNIGHKHGRN